MLVPTAENDRFRFFRRGSVVDPCGRVDTRPYKAARFDMLAQPISILPQGDRKFSILPFQFSIQQQDGGQSLAALRTIRQKIPRFSGKIASFCPRNLV